MQNPDNIDNIYTIINRLYQSIYLVRNENNHNQYVAKVSINQNQQNFNREVQITTIISGLNNPNLIHLNSHGNGTINFGGNVENNRNYLILDYYPKGDLFKYVLFQGFIELHSKYIFDKILRAVQAFHGVGICHRNLKLSKILLDQKFNPIINDFCFATNNNVDAINDFFGGTLNYMSPQIINNIVYNGFKADIFSLGVLLFKLVTGKMPFNKATQNDNLYHLIIQGNFDAFWNHFHELNLSQ